MYGNNRSILIPSTGAVFVGGTGLVFGGVDILLSLVTIALALVCLGILLLCYRRRALKRSSN